MLKKISYLIDSLVNLTDQYLFSACSGMLQTLFYLFCVALKAA